MRNIQNLKRWLIFILERFPPYTHIPFMLLYFVAHYTFYLNSSLESIPRIKLLILFIGTLVFFFKLRLYDELKDYQNDLTIYPNRPLIRGLLTHKDLYRGIYIAIMLEIISFSLFGFIGLLAIGATIIYSLLMFKEFFIRKWIRSHLTIYALMHTLVSALFSLALLATFKSTFIWNLDTNSYLFALLSWCLFNIFEFGRKTFISNEERSGVESYSKIYGRLGATLLVINMATISALILNGLGHVFINPFILVSLLSLVALFYFLLNRQPLGKIYRGSSFAFIASMYIIFIAYGKTIF